MTSTCFAFLGTKLAIRAMQIDRRVSLAQQFQLTTKIPLAQSGTLRAVDAPADVTEPEGAEESLADSLARQCVEAGVLLHGVAFKMPVSEIAALECPSRR